MSEVKNGLCGCGACAGGWYLVVRRWGRMRAAMPLRSASGFSKPSPRLAHCLHL